MGAIGFATPKPYVPPPILDLTTFTEVDPGSDITRTSTRCTFVLPTNINAYVYKDYGAAYFGNFDIDFEVKIDGGNTSNLCAICVLSNTLGGRSAWTSANDAIIVDADLSSNNLLFHIRDFNTDNSDFWNPTGTSTSLLYCTFTRSGSTVACTFYSDAARTIPLDTVSITGETGTKRYLHVLGSWDAGIGGTINGYTQNYKIITAS